MKRFFVIVALICSAPLFAQDAGDLIKEKDALQDRLAELEQRFAQNEDQGKLLSQRIDDLNWAAEQLEKQSADVGAESTALDVRTAQLESEIDSHNSVCGGSSEDEAFVNSCNSRADYLNAQSQEHNAAIEQWNRTNELLNEAYQTQEEQRSIVATQVSQYLQTQQELIEAAQVIQARLAEIEPFLTGCQQAISRYDASPNPAGDGTMEQMKAACGNIFDGN